MYCITRRALFFHELFISFTDCREAFVFTSSTDHDTVINSGMAIIFHCYLTAIFFQSSFIAIFKLCWAFIWYLDFEVDFCLAGIIFLLLASEPWLTIASLTSRVPFLLWDRATSVNTYESLHEETYTLKRILLPVQYTSSGRETSYILDIIRRSSLREFQTTLMIH